MEPLNPVNHSIFLSIGHESEANALLSWFVAKMDGLNYSLNALSILPPLNENDLPILMN